jgi:hypothetical protein
LGVHRYKEQMIEKADAQLINLMRMVCDCCALDPQSVVSCDVLVAGLRFVTM